MAALARLVAPPVAAWLSGDGGLPMVKAPFPVLGIGLVWQFVLVVALVWREQRSLRWPVVRQALWLGSPRNPRSGQVARKIQLVPVPCSCFSRARC